MTTLWELVAPARFMPHGHCYQWQADLVALHAGSDVLTFLAYLTIPFTMALIARRRDDLPFRGLFRWFILFIACCGFTHLAEAWTLWVPSYYLSGSIKLVTASVSCVTAFLLMRSLPVIASLPSHQQLSAARSEQQASELALRDAADNMLDAFLLAEVVRGDDGQLLDLTLRHANPVARDRLDLPTAGVGQRLGGQLPAHLWADLAAVAAGGEAIDRTRIDDGRWLRHQVVRSGPEALLLLQRDITESRQVVQLQEALGERELLVQEVHHRVKNNLQLISSMLRMAARDVTRGRLEAATAFQRSQARIHAIARVHERLYNSTHADRIALQAFLTGMVADLTEGVAASPDDVQADITPTDAPTDAALQLGLLVQELVSNALEHGEPPVRVTWRPDGAGWRLTVEDHGPPLPPSSTQGATTRGMVLVSSFVAQLNGRWEAVPAPSGHGKAIEVTIPPFDPEAS